MDCCTSRWLSPWEQCRGTCHSFLFSFLVLVDVYLIREQTCSEGFNRTARFSWDRSDLKRSLLIMDKFYFISVCFTCLRMDSAIVDNFEIVENVPRLKSGMFVIWPLTNIPVATDNTGTPETISSFLTISTKNLDNFDKLFPSRYSWQLEHNYFKQLASSQKKKQQTFVFYKEKIIELWMNHKLPYVWLWKIPWNNDYWFENSIKHWLPL